MFRNTIQHETYLWSPNAEFSGEVKDIRPKLIQMLNISYCMAGSKTGCLGQSCLGLFFSTPD